MSSLCCAHCLHDFNVLFDHPFMSHPLLGAIHAALPTDHRSKCLSQIPASIIRESIQTCVSSGLIDSVTAQSVIFAIKLSEN